MHDVKNKEKEKTPAILALFPHTACTSGTGANMGVPTQQVPSVTDVHWYKHWYEFWKKTIKVVD